jgi:uncharacterized protein YyaL (SSP411 family)/aryl-alcohol dehydrogenase-like predicted oxidoreductase
MADTTAAPTHTNRLIHETSPYLLQHAHNPVDWYPWGEEALRRAKEEDKPILLSIGYSACHWCHVMEHESFEDERIARLMNENFVCVKVDREERPDLDEIYMTATQMMTGQGGWPMTVFLTPDQKPFFAGTYFPPEDKYGRPGFGSLLTRIAKLWRDNRDELEAQASLMSEQVREQARPAVPLAVGVAELDAVVAQLAREFDPVHGGFGRAPKFPPSMALSLLLRYHRRMSDGGTGTASFAGDPVAVQESRREASGGAMPGLPTAAETLQMVGKTLDAMARGGMYDQVGGGFHRYSVDERWLVPHFEKMLYDNALLARVYLEGYQVALSQEGWRGDSEALASGSEAGAVAAGSDSGAVAAGSDSGAAFYRRIAREVLDYILREMTSPEGGFYSATDADSEGEEGKFFVWTPAEIEAVLGLEEGRRFCAYYDITEVGNWEGKSIPNVRRTVGQVAGGLGIAPEELRRSLEESRPKVYQARLVRVAPGLDDKILTAWNGLMIGTLAEGARVLGDRRCLEAAERAAEFIRSTMVRPDGGLFRTYRAGKAHLGAYLEDYAYLCEALVGLYEAGAGVDWLLEARRLAERMLADFEDEEAGGFYTTARGHEELLLRHREGTDGATPSANAVTASTLARLSFHFDREDFREAATRAIAAHGKAIQRLPRAFPTSLAVVDFLLEGPVELAFVGTPGEAGHETLVREAARHYLPNRIIGHKDPAASDRGRQAEREDEEENVAADLPLLAGKEPVNGRAALYVCRDFACQRPVTDPSQVAEALGSAWQEAAVDEPAPGQATRRARPAATPGGAVPHPAGTIGAPRGRRNMIGTFLSGHATAEGTAACASRHILNLGPAAYGPLGSTGLTVSKIGFGAYRVDDETPEHREALEKALENGINLIDTSTNYTDGGSERLIGAVLKSLVRRGRLRQEIVLVSKVGYVQGGNLTLAMEREAAGRPFPEMVKYMDGVWHCIHPEFIHDQLGRSRERLGLETLDFCLLHNPEYFLSDAKRRGAAGGGGLVYTPAHAGLGGEPVQLADGGLESLRSEFYRRLREAFRHLEREVSEGRIRWYGVSSNTAAAPANDPEATSLARMLQAAREAGGDDHHFRVLQLPMNLFESGPAVEQKEGLVVQQTVLEYAQREEIAVLVNRPLNAVVGGGMLRLADVDPTEVGTGDGGERVDPEAKLRGLAELEEDYRRRIAANLRTQSGSPPVQDFFRLSEQLRIFEKQVPPLDQWDEIEAGVLLHVTQLVAALDGAMTDDLARTWDPWRDRYVRELRKLMGELRRRAAEASQATSQAVAGVLDPLLPSERRGQTLAKKALWVLVSSPGVSSVLNGMRDEAYVDDAVEALRWEPLSNPLPVYEGFGRLELTRPG